MIARGMVGQGAQASLVTDMEAWALEEDMASWRNMLPDSLRRAAPEIYRNLVGVAWRRSVRNVIDDYFPLSSRGASSDYLELYNIVSAVDFLAEKHKHSSVMLVQSLASDDTAQIGLRRIASWFHEKRTGDKAAAQSMLAIQPWGQFSNAAPQCLLKQAQAVSKSEHQNLERVHASAPHARAVGSSGGQKQGQRQEERQGREVWRRNC